MSEENIYTFENPEYRKIYWHTCSHVLAQAMKRLHPEVKLAIGPSIENGFYYDFDTPRPFTPEDLAELERQLAACQAEQELCGSDYVKLQRLQDRQAELEQKLEEKMERWVYLNELKEKIDAQ